MKEQRKNFSVAFDVQSPNGQGALDQHFGLDPTYFSPPNTVLPNGRLRECGVWSCVTAYQNRDPNDVFSEYHDLILTAGVPANSAVTVSVLFSSMADFFPVLIDMTQVARLLKLNMVVQFDDVLMDESLPDSTHKIEGYRAIVLVDGVKQPKAALLGPEEIEDGLKHFVNMGHRNFKVICFESWPGLVFENLDGFSWAETSVLLVQAR